MQDLPQKIRDFTTTITTPDTTSGGTGGNVTIAVGLERFCKPARSASDSRWSGHRGSSGRGGKGGGAASARRKGGQSTESVDSVSAADCVIFSPGSFWKDDPALFAADASMHSIGRQSTVPHTAALLDLIADNDAVAAAAAAGDAHPKAQPPLPPPPPPSPQQQQQSQSQHQPSPSSSTSSLPSRAKTGAYPLPRSVLLPGLRGISGMMVETFHAPNAAILIALKPPGTAADLQAETAFFAALEVAVLQKHPDAGSTGQGAGTRHGAEAATAATARHPPSSPAASPSLSSSPSSVPVPVSAPVPPLAPVYIRYLEQRISSHEQTYFFFVYLLVFCYIYLSVDTVKTSVKSKFGLGFTAVAIVFSSMAMANGLCKYMGLATALIAEEVVPFLVVSIGLDNMSIITKRVRGGGGGGGGGGYNHMY